MRIYDADITGSLTYNSQVVTSFGTVDAVSSSVVILKDASGSFSTRVTSVESSLNNLDNTYATDAQVATAVSSLNAATSSYLKNTTDTLTGDLTVTGTITAQEFHTEFVSASIIYQSGSTQFGNSSDDTHIFTGNVGIGTSTTGVLTIKNANDADLLVLENTTGLTAAKFQISENNGLYITSYEGSTDRRIVFQTGTTERMRIDSGGDVYINGKTENLLGTGTSDGSDSKSLTLTSATDASSARGGYVTFYGNEHASLPGQVRLVAGNTTNAELRINAVSSTGFITNYVAGSERMRIDSSGVVQVRNQTPTIQLYNTDDSLALNQTLGDIDWYQIDPSDQGVGTVAKIRAVNNSTFAGYGGLAFYTGNATTLAERLRIDSSGNVGIGTNSSSANLHINEDTSNTYGTLRIEGSNRGGQIDMYNGIYPVSQILTDQSGNTYFSTSGGFTSNTLSYRMSILTDGNVGIGTTSPGYPLHLSSTSVYQAAIKSTGAQYLLIGSENASTAGIILDGDSNGDGAGGDYSYIIHENTGELKIVQDSPSGTNSLSFGTAGTENRVIINGSGNVGINSTSPAYTLDVQGQIANRKGLLSAYGVYTDGGTYTNQWQKVFEIAYPNAFAFAGMKLLVIVAGDTSNINMNAEVHINYKFQNNNGRINVNIVNFGELPLTTDDFEVYRDGTNTKLVFYHRVTRNYARPYYTLLNNSDSSMSWSNTVVGASLSGEANDGFTEKNIANTINARPDTGNVGIGTTAPIAKLEVQGGDTQLSQILNVSGYSQLGQTTSGAMTILGHNARVDTSANNRITAANSSWPASFIKMYYTQGISFHTTDTNQTAGDILFDGAGSTSLERMRVTDNGITFNGDSAAANALDDYEEGTWTPTGAINSYTRCNYTKIGRTVFLQGTIQMATSSLGSGVQIGGLPFNSTSAFEAVGSVMWNNASPPSNAVQLTTYLYGGNNNISFYWSYSTTTGWTNTTYAQVSGADLIIQLTYQI